MPWPTEAEPETTSTMPSPSTLISDQIGRSEAAFFHEKRETHPDQLARGLSRGEPLAQQRPLDSGQRLVEETRIIAGIENNFGAERVERTRIGHFVFGNQVAPPYLDAIQIELVRDRIQ